MLPLPPQFTLDALGARPDNRTLPGIAGQDPSQDRFADAYEQQVGYLSKVAAEEERRVQLDITHLRGLAYTAQRTAAEYQAKTDAARRALSAGAMSSWALRDAISVTRAEIDSEMAAVQASRASIQHEEAAAASLRAKAREEAFELSAKCEAARMRRHGEEEVLTELARSLQAVRSERLAEQDVAEFHRQRAVKAAEAREQALADLGGQEEAATRALQAAIGRLEAEFAQERVDFQRRDKAAMEDIREFEHQLDRRRSPSDACLTGSSLSLAQRQFGAGAA